MFVGINLVIIILIIELLLLLEACRLSLVGRSASILSRSWKNILQLLSSISRWFGCCRLLRFCWLQFLLWSLCLLHWRLPIRNFRHFAYMLTWDDLAFIEPRTELLADLGSDCLYVICSHCLHLTTRTQRQIPFLTFYQGEMIFPEISSRSKSGRSNSSHALRLIDLLGLRSRASVIMKESTLLLQSSLNFSFA